jgi:hypothetical protein
MVVQAKTAGLGLLPAVDSCLAVVPGVALGGALAAFGNQPSSSKGKTVRSWPSLRPTSFYSACA